MRIPSFTNNSEAIRSSAQVRFAAAISAINRTMSRYIGSDDFPRGGAQKWLFTDLSTSV
jgi:hypothetical protein